MCWEFHSVRVPVEGDDERGDVAARPDVHKAREAKGLSHPLVLGFKSQLGMAIPRIAEQTFILQNAIRIELFKVVREDVSQPHAIHTKRLPLGAGENHIDIPMLHPLLNVISFARKVPAGIDFAVMVGGIKGLRETFKSEVFAFLPKKRRHLVGENESVKQDS